MMKSPIQRAVLFGAIRLFEDPPAFVVPAFKEYDGDTKLVMQAISGDKITAFVDIDPRDLQLICTSNPTERRVGDAPLIAFEDGSGNILVEERARLSALLRSVVVSPELVSRPFTRSALAYFCGLHRLSSFSDIEAISKFPDGSASREYFRLNVLLRDKIKQAWNLRDGSSPELTPPPFRIYRNRHRIRLELSGVTTREEAVALRDAVARCKPDILEILGDSEETCDIKVIEQPAEKLDRRTIERIFLNERIRLIARAKKLTQNSDEAEDIVQETLLQALKLTESGFAPNQSDEVREWLSEQLIRNYRIRRFRKSTEPVVMSTEILTNFLDKAVADLVPDLRAERSLELRDLESAISALDQKDRQIVLLVGLEGMRLEEVALILDMPVSTLSRRLARARMKLKAMLGQR